MVLPDRPCLLNEKFKVHSYDGGAFKSKGQYDIKNVLVPLLEPFHCSSSGTKFNLVLKCADDFTLTHFYVSGPGPRCTEPIKSGLVWVLEQAPDVERLKKYDSMCAEELLEIVKGLRTYSSSEQAGSVPDPCLYFTTDSTSREAELELPKWREGKYVVVKFLDTHKDQGNIDVGIVGMIGYFGRHAKKQIPLGPWMKRTARQVWVHPNALKSMFSSSGWVCDGRDFTGGCRSGQTDFHQTNVYTVTFRCTTSGFDLCEKCAYDPTLGQVNESSIRSDLEALADPSLCKLGATRLRNLWRRNWAEALPRYFAAGLLDSLVQALQKCLEGQRPEEERARPDGSDSRKSHFTRTASISVQQLFSGMRHIAWQAAISVGLVNLLTAALVENATDEDRSIAAVIAPSEPENLCIRDTQRSVRAAPSLLMMSQRLQRTAPPNSSNHPLGIRLLANASDDKLPSQTSSDDLAQTLQDALQWEMQQIEKSLGKDGATQLGAQPGRVMGVALNGKDDIRMLQSALMIGVAGVLTLAKVFSLFRRLRPVVYIKEADLEIEDVTDTDASPCTAPRHYANPHVGLFDWVSKVWQTTPEDEVKLAGLDGWAFLEFRRLNWRIFSVLGPVLCAVLLPLHYEAHQDSEYELDMLSKFDIGRDPLPDWMLWVHAVMVWFVVCVSTWTITRTQEHFTERRYQWLKEIPFPRAKTVLIRNIPSRYRSDAALKQYFVNLFSEEVIERAYVVRHTGRLTYQVAALKQARLDLLHAKQHWQEAGRPDRASSESLRLEHCEKREQTLTQEVAQAQARLDEGVARGDPVVCSSTGFVTFTDELSQRLASREQCTRDVTDFSMTTAPDPNDLIYANLAEEEMNSAGWNWAGLAAIWGVFTLWVPFVVLISSWTTFGAVQEMIPTLKDHRHSALQRCLILVLSPSAVGVLVMSQESTVPFVVASPGPEAEGEGRDVGDGGDGADVMLDAPPGVPVPAETVLDHPTPAPLGRGRTRERERERDRSGAGFPLRLNNPAEGDLAAAAAAVAALHAATGPEAAVSVDALRTHPEKKAKFSSGTKMPPPAFGGTSGGESLGGRGGAKGSGHHPPLFHGGAAPPKAAATPNPLPTGAGPQVFHLDAEPPWLDAIRGDLKEIVDTQRQLAKDMALNSSELRGIQEGVRNLSIGQESLTRRADEQEASLEQMKRELREMEREVQQLRSAPPTRGPSPVSTPRNGVSAPASPRGREIDELQLVIGGWQEARRQEIEEDVRFVDPPLTLEGLDMHELGDVKGLAEGAHRDDLFDIAGELYELDNQSHWDQASQDLHAFYARKFSSLEEPLNSAHWRAAEDYHLRVPAPTPITLDEVTQALDKCNAGVSAGLDGITYEGLKGLLRLDPQERLVGYLNDLLQGVKLIPASWRLGKIVFLPKVPRPSKPADLRPICLVPTLSRLFSKILMERLRLKAPEYHANQMACRPSVQVVDGILAAQSTMALIRTTTGSPAKVAKLDIKAAFDSISHHAVYRWLMACKPGWEAERIMHLCFGTRVVVSIGGESKELPMQQGIMQGSAFSADIFSCVVDWYLGGLLSHMDELEPQWHESVACLPHFLVYADDITVFATTEMALQSKVRLLVILEVRVLAYGYLGRLSPSRGQTPSFS
ncbi:pol [Symbiodinium sp. KB8]|nr:pol [Symbiodinium sp. KB8]